MIRRPPRSPLFPYPPLFRSRGRCRPGHGFGERSPPHHQKPPLDHWQDRKSTRLNSSHSQISYAVFCLGKTERCLRSAQAAPGAPPPAASPTPTCRRGAPTSTAGAAGPCASRGRPSSSFFNDTATTEIYTLSLHDALPILLRPLGGVKRGDHALEAPPGLRARLP